MARDDLVGKVVGSYRLGEVLHRGEASSIYVGEDTSSMKRVAVKVYTAELSKDKATRLTEAVQRAVGVKHPHLCTVLDAGTLESRGKRSLYVVMERLQGKPLSERLASQGSRPLPLSQALQIVSDIGAALAALHRDGRVHGDVGVDAVFLCEPAELDGEEGARLMGLESALVRAAQAGEGEPKPGSAADDIRDLGRLLHVLLTGSQKAGASVLSLREVNREVPVHVTAALRTALGESDGEGFSSVSSFVGAVLGTGDLAPSIGVWSVDGSAPVVHASRPPMSMGLVVGLLMVLGGGVGLWRYLREPPGPGPVVSDLSVRPPVPSVEPDLAQAVADLSVPGRAKDAAAAQDLAQAPRDLAQAPRDLAQAGAVKPEVTPLPVKKWRTRPGPPIPPVRGPVPDAAPKPEAPKPEAVKPEAVKPEAPKPEAVKPEAVKPEAAQPEAVKPEAAKPETAKPEVTKPEVGAGAGEGAAKPKRPRRTGPPIPPLRV